MDQQLLVRPDDSGTCGHVIERPQLVNGRAVGFGDGHQGLAIHHLVLDHSVRQRGGAGHAVDVIRAVGCGQRVCGHSRHGSAAIRHFPAVSISNYHANIEYKDISAISLRGHSTADVSVAVAPGVEHHLLVSPIRPGAIDCVFDGAAAGPALITADTCAAAITGPGNTDCLVAAIGADMPTLTGCHDPFSVRLGSGHHLLIGIELVVSFGCPVGIYRRCKVVTGGLAVVSRQTKAARACYKGQSQQQNGFFYDIHKFIIIRGTTPLSDPVNAPMECESILF